MKNKEIAEIFQNIGALLEMKEENIFRVRSYYKAAESLRALAEDIVLLRQGNRLKEVPGIGKTLEEKIAEYLDTGKISAYEILTQEIPVSLLQVMEIPSVGPKKAKLFYAKLGIKDLDGLEAAAKSGKLLEIAKCRQKTVANILNGIATVREGKARMTLGVATTVAEKIVASLQTLPEVKQIIPAGSLRRGKETVRDIDILVESSNPAKVMDAFVNLPQVKTINSHGETKSSIMTDEGIQVDLRVVESKSFGAALLYFTGSTNFNIKLRQIAMKKDLKVNEYGIFSMKGKAEKFLVGKTEKECLEALDLPYLPPELREDIGEARIFNEGLVKIPKLLEVKDIKGELHVHSRWSDGRNTIQEMAEAAQAKGYEYLGVSDHSYKLRIAGGVSVEDLKKKKSEIENLNKKLKNFRILFGTEVEIDMDGNLDYNEKILSEFDVVIAAIHSGFEQSKEKLTERLIKACRSKYVNIIAHPTGVILGRREPYAIDLKAVSRAAAEGNTFLEINAFPNRLDLNSNNVYFAAKEGVNFAINTDSHSINHLGYIKFGVAMARRGWLTKERVLNTLPLNELMKKLKK